MGQSKSKNAARPDRNEPQRAGGRVGVALAAAVLVGGAVVAGVVLTDRGSGDAPAAGSVAPAPSSPPAQPGNGGSTVLGGVAPGSPTGGGLSGAPAAPVTPEVAAKVEQVLQQVEHLDNTVFAKEVESQKYEEFFIQLWDDIRAAEDKFDVLQRAQFQSLAYGQPGQPEAHDWDVTTTRYEGSDNTVDAAGWQALIAGLREQGYRLTEIEFHQSSFEHEQGQPARSTVSTILHLVNGALSSRTAVRTKLKVEWADEPVASQKPGVSAMFVPRTIEATDLIVADRKGQVPFQPLPLPGGTAERGLKVDESSQFLLAYDLDGDGDSEIVIPRENVIFRNGGKAQFTREPLLPGGTIGKEGLHAGVLGDFDGDGIADLLCSRGPEMFLVRGVAGGRFSSNPPELAVKLSFPLMGVSALTAADIDGDGDLDAFFGQYKRPYVDGQMPTPYYDANDGYAGALLVNDGTGRFEDRTEAAGLAAKRHRRTFGASFVDLDGDRDLDLLVNSDFSGLDIYYNDGGGNFTDVTDQVIDDRHNFGMGHTFADYNLDGRLDMYTIGMSSTTARRLTAMGAGREEFPQYQAKRPQMGYGNRMFFAPAADATPGQAPRRYQQPAYKDDVARTGWSWGASSPDFDNDGDPDLYVANGHLSGQTCRDYCTTYWRRDLYLGNSKEDAAMKTLFDNHGMPREVSWNGFEHNVLFMNEGGKGFINVAHLMGVAYEFDSRGVIADDFDGDGKVDLLVTEQSSWNKTRHLHLLKNNWPSTFNWVGVRLAETRPAFSPLGASIRVRTARGVQPAQIVTGDSYLAQHANAKHFGIGADDAVEWIEVTWPNGQSSRVDGPAVNKWHDVRPPQPGAAAAAAAQ